MRLHYLMTTTERSVCVLLAECTSVEANNPAACLVSDALWELLHDLASGSGSQTELYHDDSILYFSRHISITDTLIQGARPLNIQILKLCKTASYRRRADEEFYEIAKPLEKSITKLELYDQGLPWAVDIKVSLEVWSWLVEEARTATNALYVGSEDGENVRIVQCFDRSSGLCFPNFRDYDSPRAVTLRFWPMDTTSIAD